MNLCQDNGASHSLHDIINNLFLNLPYLSVRRQLPSNRLHIVKAAPTLNPFQHLHSPDGRPFNGLGWTIASEEPTAKAPIAARSGQL